MFNTNFNHFLQQFDYSWLKFIAELISTLGTIPFILIIVFAIAFGLHFKRGIVIINIVAWTALFTIFAKQQVDFPRPIDVDITLQSDDYNKIHANLKDKLPAEFTATFSDEILEITRNDAEKNFGFPSGHTSIQVALWLGMFFIFRKRWILFAGTVAVLLTMFSRIYLAHHFLGDTIGGFVLGSIILSLLILLVQKSHFLKAPIADFKTLSLLWLPFLAIPFASYLSVATLGSLLGINLATLFIVLQGNTLIFSTNTFKRIVTAAAMISIVFLGFYISNRVIPTGNVFIKLLTIMSIFFILIRGGILIAKQLNFIKYKV